MPLCCCLPQGQGESHAFAATLTKSFFFPYTLPNWHEGHAKKKGFQFHKEKCKKMNANRNELFFSLFLTGNEKCVSAFVHAYFMFPFATENGHVPGRKTPVMTRKGRTRNLSLCLVKQKGTSLIGRAQRGEDYRDAIKRPAQKAQRGTCKGFLRCMCVSAFRCRHPPFGGRLFLKKKK